MSDIKNKLYEEIAKQQLRFKKYEPPYTVGEQLKDIGAESAQTAEILYADLQNTQMNLAAAADMLKNYSDKNHGKEKVFCISPKKADELLRDFYKLPVAPSQIKGEENKENEGYIDIANFF